MSHEQHGPGSEAQSTTESSQAIKKQQGGFDCEFIEQPQEAFQANCPVCLMVLCEPHQVTCCGNSFCQTCIGRVQARNKPCPTCNSVDFLLFPNKGLKRSLYVFRVRCSHKNEGCQWTGELWDLVKHLARCEFAETECHHCCQLFQRCFIAVHTSECPQRPFSCEYCGKFRARYADMETKHWPVCKFYPVACPNKCGVNSTRRNVVEHLRKVCCLTVVSCEFRYAGCEVQLPRRDMPGHRAENLLVHVSLVAVHGRKEIEEVKQNLDESQQAVGELQRQNQILVQDTQCLRIVVEEKNEKIAQLEQKMAALMPSFPAVFTVTGFDELKRESRGWCSPPFYTHPQGYKMCLQVATDFEQKGTEIAIGACLLRGEFDDFLAWPFQGAISMELVNQSEDGRHLLHCAGFHRSAQLRVLGSATEGCRQMTVAYDQLAYSEIHNCQYLKNDRLCLRVLSVSNVNWTEQCLRSELCITVPPIEFQMTEFTRYRRGSDKWYSLPFYAHAKGYKLCLSVQFTRFYDAADTSTPMGVAVHLLRGKFDPHLKWPFRGDVTVQLLNQLENKHHHERVIQFCNDIPEACERVTTGGRAAGKGPSEFIALNELDNPARHCQYLKDDSLYFRITKVVLKK